MADRRTDADLQLLLRAVEEGRGIGSWIWELEEDGPGARFIASDGFFRLYELDPGAPDLRDRITELVHPDDREAVVRLMSAMDHVTATMPYRVLFPDGRVRWLASDARDVGGRPGWRRIVGTIADVTRHQAIAEEVARTQALLGETQRAGGLGTFQADPGPGDVQLSGGLAPHPDERARIRAWAETVGSDPRPLVIRGVAPDGTGRTLELRGGTAEPGSRRIVGVVLDLTERLELEAQLRHAVKLEAVGTLAAGVAHDFNNSLTVLSVHLDLIAERGPSEAALSAMRRSVDQCRSLTGQLLSFARKRSSEARPIDAVAEVAHLAGLVRRVVGPRIQVATDLPDAPCVVHVDPGQLEGALMNLVVNARDAMSDGPGVLTLAVAREAIAEGDPRLVEGAQPGSWVVLAVRDTGIGIPAAHLQRIFEPYFSTKGLGQGTGLGLASVYGTVRQHGGLVGVDSVEGAGTTFRLYLPESVEPVVPPPSTRPPRSEPPRRGALLLVEDVAEVREIAADVLRSVGWDVEEAEDGIDALDRLAARDFDLVVTDLRMPRMGGLELVRRLRVDGSRARVLLMTGYSDYEDVAPLGLTVLHKPFSTADLIAHVDRVARATATPMS